MQGAQIFRNEAYLQYAAMTKDEVQSACGGQMDFLRSRQSKNRNHKIAKTAFTPSFQPIFLPSA